MKKIHMIAALLAMLLPTVLFGGDDHYYAALKVTVKSGAGTVYAATSSTAESNRQYSKDGNTTSGVDSKNSAGGSVGTFYAYAKPDAGWKFVKWTNTSGSLVSDKAEYGSFTLTASNTKDGTLTTEYQAYFEKEVLPSFNITFETSSAGTYTVDGAAPANKTGLEEATSVVLKSTDANFLNWVVNGSIVNDNPYTATCLADTTISAEFLTADQVTSVTTLPELTAALSNAAYKKIIVPSGTSLTVAKGSTVTVPAGKQLVIDGTLNVLGTVSNSGVISGSGKLYKISYSIDQGDVITVKTADGKECGAMTCACQDTKMPRYCKTTVTQNSPSVNGTVSCMTSWGVLLNGTTAYAISKQSPKAVKVSLDTAKDSNGKQSVVNKITAVTADTDTVNENANYVLFADMTMTGPLDNSKLRSTATVDCAGKKLSAGTNSHSSFGISVLNGSFSASASQWQNAHAAFFNVSSVSLSKVKGTGSTYYFYDCGTKASPCSVSITYYSSTRTSDYKTAYFYSGYYSYSFNTTNDSGKCNVYGGSYTADPASYIPTAYDGILQSKYDGSKYYVVTDYTPPSYVCAVGGVEYETLPDAVAAAGNGSLITLSAAIELEETLTIPSGKNITISLEKHTIQGGKIVNNGTLTITDSITGNGTTVNDVSGGIVKCDIENNGTLDFIFGSYTGAIVNKAGTLTTHNGLFSGALTKDGGTVNLKGGHFAQDVSSFVTTDGYDVITYGGKYSVCELPDGTLYDTEVSSAAGYGATPFSNADFTLFKKWVSGSTSRTDYSAAEWARVSEIMCFYQVFNSKGLDPTLMFDRVVAASSVNLYAKSGQTSVPVPLKFDVSAGTPYRALSEYLIGNGYYSKTYKAIFVDNISSVGVAVSDKSGSNKGTVCKVMVEIWSDDRASDYSSTGRKVTNTVYVVGQKLFTIDAGSNKAMIRPAAGAATFYATLGDAMGAAADGGTVMLANDCDTALPLNKAGTYTFDTMGFAASDAVSVSDGLFVKSETTVDSSAKVLVPDAKATTYVVAQKVASVGETFYDNLTEAVGAANGTTVTLLAATDETITLGEGQTLSLNKNGIAFDDAKVVTSVEGSSVKATTAEGVTVYSLVKDVVTSGEAHYPSIEAAIEAAEGNTVAVTVVAADTETIDLDAGKTLVVTVADGVTANVTVDPADGAFIDATTDGNVTTYESKKITVKMEEPQSGSTVEVTKIESGTETTVSDATEINAAVTQLMGNRDVPRTDNTDKLDVVDVITVTPTKIVQEVVGAATAFIRSATFDVVPTFKAGQSLTAGQKLKFRLPVDAAATQLAAVVYHGAAQFGIFAVQTYNNEKFVEVESDTFSPYGYELLDGETANPVAAIGTTGYTSLAAAVAAASAGDTITMLADDTVSLTSGARLTIDKSITITGAVDTNDEPLYTIYGTPAQTGSNNIYIDGSGTVTLSNLKIKDFGNNKGTDGAHAPVYVASSFTGTVNLDNLYISDFNRGGVFLYGGTFNVTDCYIDCANSRSGAFTKGIEIKGTAAGTIADTVICNMERSSTTYSTAGIEVYGNGTITVDGCTILSDVDPHQSVKGTYGIVSSRVGEHDPSGGSLHVTDCYIDVSNAALSVADDDEYGPVNNYSIVVDGEDTYFSNYIATWSAGSSITVAEGEFNEDVYADAGTINITVNITGGTFNNFLPDTGTGTISISGGIFDKEVSEAYCAEGYIPAVYDEDTGLYTVKQGAYVAQIGDVKYETFAEAIAAAEAMSPVPTITVIDATAVQENNGWMFSQDGNTLFRKVAMVVFSTDKYATATTNYYPSAAEAFAAADEFVYTAASSIRYLNTDVTLLADDTLPGDATTVIEGKKQGGYYDYRSIDLNGHTLVAPKGVAIERVSANVTMKILDSSESKTGSIVNTSTDADAFALRVNSSVSMTMESGSIVAKGAGTALKTIGTGSATLNGGSISADPDGKAINSLDTSSVKMPEDSAIVVTGPLVETAGSIEVKGGSFSSAVPAECMATGYEDAGQTAVVAGYYTVKREIYTITFLDENDNVIISGQLEYNALYSTLPVPAIPVKVSDDPAFYYTGAWAPSASANTRATGNATHKLTYTQGKYGFQYGDGLYTNTFANAYKAVADGGTVTVLNDAFALTSTTLNLAKDVTIDLNGSVLTLNNTGMLTVSGDGTKVTFANGTIKYGSGTTARDALVKVTSPAEVAFEGVTLQGASYYTTAVSVASGASAAFSGECVVTMPSGKQAVTAADGGTVAISGGLYSTEVPAAYCAADYKPADGTVEYDGKNYYTVTLKGVAQIGDTYYDTFAAAIAAADAAVAGGNDDPVIIALDPTAAQDNADWMFVTDSSVEPAVTTLVRRTFYNVWVGGTRIAADNAADVFGDGKVSYDDATKTLTLNGYTYSGAGYGSSAVYIGDVGGATFNIVVAGENALTSTAAYGYAIRSVGTGAVTVTGSGSDPSLALTVPSAYDTGYAVSVKGTSATFKDLSMAVTGYLGFVVNGNNAAGDALTIDNCDVVFDGTAIDQAIWVYNTLGDGTVSIENGSSLTGKGAILVYGYGTSAGDANLSIVDSTVNLTGATTASASGSSRHAIEVLSNVGDSVLTIDNSTVTVTASNGLHPNGNGPDGINVGSQMSANGKGLAKIDIKNGSVVTATGNANGVNLFTWGDSSNVNPCGAELSVVDSTLNASATHATGGHYGIVAYAYQKGDTSVVFENSTVNASAPASAGIYIGAGEDFNADVGSLSYEAIDSDVTTSGPYGLVVSTVSADGNNTSVLQTVDISGGSFTCNGLLFVYGDDGENTASVSMSDVTAQIGTTTATEEPVLGTVTTGELSIDSGDYTILHAADLDAFDAADGNISGGNFNEQVPEELCADTYIPTPQDPVTGTYTVKHGSYVAQIVRGGEVIAKYESFAEALEAAENGDTIQLLTDVTGVTTTYNIDKTLTIDGQGQYAIVAGENTEPRSVIAAWGGSRVMFEMTRSTANVTFKDITLDNGEGHYYSFLARVKSGTTTLDNVTLLNGGETDASGTDGVGYGAAVQVDGGTVIVNGDFYADSHGEVGNENGGIFPFTALLYQSGGIHFDDGVTAGIGKDLLLVGMVGAVDVSTDAGREQVNEMLVAMNVPAGYYPYTLKLGDSAMTSFTGASPLGWNGIIDYGTDIMNAANTSMGMDMDPDTTPVEVGLLADTVLPETFTYEDSNLTINGNGNAISGTIEYTDDAGTMENIVMGTDDKPLVLDMTGLSEGNAINLGSSIAASNVTIKVTEEQATTLGQAIVTWNAEGESEEDAASLESGIKVEIVDASGQPAVDPVTGDPMEASIIWDAEMGVAYIGPCEARLTGPTHEQPIYTSLANAIAWAAQTGDTVTLMTNVVNVSGTYTIAKQDLVLDGAGYTVAAAPMTEHRNMFEAWSGSRNMFKVESGDVTFRNIELDGDASHAYTFLISADNGGITLTTENVRLVNGGEQSVDSDGTTLTPGNGYGAAIHLNNGAHIVVSNGFYACSGGKTAGCFPFTAILVDENGGDVKFELTGEPNDPANVDIGEDLLLVGMLGDLISENGVDAVQGMLDYMKVPSRFIPYTLTLADGSAYAFTGASPRRWNDIIDYGKDIMDVATANGFSGLDKDTTPVEVGLATDTILPAGADGDGYDFLYEDSNFSINGNGNALSGTIKFTDDADGGMLTDIELGTDTNPLTLDLSETDNPVDLGDGVVIQDVIVLMTEDQATLGKVVFEWDDSVTTPPDDEQGVSVTVVNNSGDPTGETKGLVWDEEYGVAYIGPVEARLTGTTHETPVYTSLANALDIAKDNDKVQLLTNAVLSAVQGVGSDVTLDLAGYNVSVNGEKGLLVTNATLVIADSLATNGVIRAGDGASPASLIESGNGGVVNIPTGVFEAASGGTVLVTSGNGTIAVSGGYFSVAVPAEYCAPGYAPMDAPTGAPQPYTVGETVPEFRYPIDGTAGVPVTNTWLAAYLSDIYDDPLKPVFANITNDLVQALSADGANGIPLWESYVLGLDPTDPKAQLRLTAAPVASDAAQVAIWAVIDTTKFPEIANVSVTFRLAEQNGDTWTDVDGCTGSDAPSFTRPLEGVVDKVLRIFADIEVE